MCRDRARPPRRPGHPRGRVAVAAALALAALPALAVAQSPSILRPASPNAEALADLYNIVFFIAVAVFLLVEGLIIYAAVAFRRREGDPEPVQVHGNTSIEIAWTIAPAVIVVVLTALSFQRLQETYQAPEDALAIDVIGHQWWWEFRYREPAVATATELVVPVGRPVRLFLESTDVLHSFWAPQLAGKVDAVPGARDAGFGQNSLWFVAAAAGRYEGQCAEFCGEQHAGMRLTVIALAPADYEDWLVGQAAPAAEPAFGTAAEHGRALVGTKGCQACHTIEGVEAMTGKVGPNLTHVASRAMLAGGMFPNDAEHLRRWIDEPTDLKPGTTMPGLELTPDEIADIVSYLQTLE